MRLELTARHYLRNPKPGRSVSCMFPVVVGLMAFSAVIAAESVSDRSRLEEMAEHAQVEHLKGHDAEAEAEYRSLISAQQAQLGPEDPQTLESRVKLAAVLSSQRKYQGAESECRAVLAAQERTLGSKHRDSLPARSGLANALFQRGEYREAEQEYREILEIVEDALKSGAVDNLTGWSAGHSFCSHGVPGYHQPMSIRHALARCLRAQGKQASAEGEYRAVIDGPKEWNFLRRASREELAQMLEEQGRWAEQESLLRHTLALCDPDVARLESEPAPSFIGQFHCYDDLATCLLRQGRPKEALECARQAERVCEQNMGADSPTFKKARNRRMSIENGM